jgi:predicted SnoaL-like aldol condensation-catalyzing enzyme
VPGIDILRVTNGKLVEHWHNEDNLGMMQQLGAIPMPAAHTTA